MANSRLARFITEVAPPQFVSVMRHRTSKVLDTINEEEREYVNIPNHDSFSSSSSKGTCACSFSASSSSTPPTSASASAGGAAAADSKYFLKEVHRSFSIFGN